jgi:predicted ATPase with chaperone activity
MVINAFIFKKMKILRQLEHHSKKTKQVDGATGDKEALLPFYWFQRPLGKVLDYLELSARSYHRGLKISQPIADLESSQYFSLHHASEETYYRRLDRCPL